MEGVNNGLYTIHAVKRKTMTTCKGKTRGNRIVAGWEMREIW